MLHKKNLITCVKYHEKQSWRSCLLASDPDRMRASTEDNPSTD